MRQAGRAIKYLNLSFNGQDKYANFTSLFKLALEYINTRNFNNITLVCKSLIAGFIANQSLIMINLKKKNSI